MKQDGHPAPLGDPTSGVVLVLEQPIGPRALTALTLSLRAVGLPDAYVTYESTGLLPYEIQATGPHALVAIGEGAARDIDAIDYPLVRQAFSECRTRRVVPLEAWYGRPRPPRYRPRAG